ncbi:monofunctional biosynthetic peptidoglycan transglycosylase [Candidatus Sodalis pierantonius str. SOPE]|uniref:Monofunctional biosynthetic peptidoglycan transglycosylase n=1 Tax=Candidatus Sodalis pierantonii str. SOPE TaxID=2342 RepID=W0HL90_9GAMM|nr:monofunctional biosynthetic peptidoglycan transglycosylase [Candidatus Sodalis pierantonius]AHF72925.1 monofunctional biosynthetic peptidoglycan transglycosylase [Candidatus Sodalis pierantonius str. SOPE]
MRGRAGDRSLLRRVWRWLLRGCLALVALWLLAIVLFAFVPVPFTAVMAERQIDHWLRGDFRYAAHSRWVPMRAIAPPMALAVMAAEDQKFSRHWGFDITAIRDALNHNARSRHIRGASTLSQQTAKNLLLWEGRSWLRKGLETGLTLGIEGVWTKRRILTVYLNIAEFGEGIFGVEAALLEAVLPNPLSLSADAPSVYVRQRQRWILRQMRQMGGDAYLAQTGLR